MRPALHADSVTVAVLASRLHQHAPERLDAVLAWSESGLRHYQPLSATPPLEGDEGRDTLEGLDPHSLTATVPTSSGLTWRTWTLPTIPPALRHLSPAEVVEALARALRRVSG